MTNNPHKCLSERRFPLSETSLPETNSYTILLFERRYSGGDQPEQESDCLELCQAVAASFNQPGHRAFRLPENRERI